MLFTDAAFLFYFLPIALLLHFLTLAKGHKGSYPNLSRICLFFLTVIFYGFNNSWWLIPFFVSIVFDFIWSYLLYLEKEAWKRKLYVTFSVIQNLSLLALFKYYGSILQFIKSVNPEMSAHLPEFYQGNEILPLPAGISFYTFESLSYVIDIYRREIEFPTNPLDFFGFIAMFPRFVAGPIVRYRDIIGQFRVYKGMNLEKGFVLFIFGLAMKVVFADNFALFIPYAFDRTEAISTMGAWIGVFAYTMQIYFDFSGYSLMAIGLGQCLGFEFPANFNQPYKASSLQDFWRRWHISLSSWLRDYLYISLGGARKGKLRTYLNIIITMTLGGIWHGSSLVFLVWGMWHGIFLCLERIVQVPKKTALPYRVFVFLIVMLGWVFFRSTKGFTEAFAILRALFHLSSNQIPFVAEGLTNKPLSLSLCCLGIYYCFFAEDFFNSFMMQDWRAAKLSHKTIVFLLFIFVLIINFSAFTPPFLYFQF